MAVDARVPPLQGADMPGRIYVQYVPPIADRVGVIRGLLIMSPTYRIDIQEIVIDGF